YFFVRQPLEYPTTAMSLFPFAGDIRLHSALAQCPPVEFSLAANKAGSTLAGYFQRTAPNARRADKLPPLLRAGQAVHSCALNSQRHHRGYRNWDHLLRGETLLPHPHNPLADITKYRSYYEPPCSFYQFLMLGDNAFLRFQDRLRTYTTVPCRYAQWHCWDRALTHEKNVGGLRLTG